MSHFLEPIVRSIVSGIVNGRYEVVISECSASRLTHDDLRRVITEYGRTFVEPPPNAYRELDVVRVGVEDQPTWSVWAPLWSIEEGRSDLTLELTIKQEGDRWVVELDDLHAP